MAQVFRIEKSGLVPASAEAVYQIAADVASYPEFLAGLDWVRVHDHAVEMAVKVGPVSLVWEQDVSYEPYRAITFRQTRGPFRWFQGGWSFSPNGKGTCVSYYTEFEIDLRLPGVNRLVHRALERNVESIMAGFRRRLAQELHQSEDSLLVDVCLPDQARTG